jgi:hypothetical protein
MRYDLCKSERKQNIGYIIQDESPEVGSTISFAEARWRVVDIEWKVDLISDNSRSSGLLCVERID